MDEYDEDLKSDSGSETTTDDENEKPDKIMSMFSSYYGMEEAVDEEEQEEEAQAGTLLIDSPNFNANYYVKDLLLEKHGPELIAEDTKIIHEIRSLDSDMQMLVYENYNKFISATETIKRMKNNVEAMECDMISVKAKMTNLSKNAIQLDYNLHEKRAKVDKLVKVRKLLQKLEFLSELPLKLSRMIQQEKYKQAVELYNQTISVLTKHSNVLSFRNIRDRTEQMMKDLRVMVTGLLDSSGALEVVKLTQYVATLRLMEAPKKQVIEKFIAAHRTRWTKLVASYAKDVLGSTSMPPLAGLKPVGRTAADALVEGVKRPTMVSVRQFHQTVISGLMEACKGVKEMYQYQKQTGNALMQSEHADAQSPATIAEAEEREAHQAHEALQTMIRRIMTNYASVVVVALQRFFSDFHRFLKQNSAMAIAAAQLDNKLASLGDPDAEVEDPMEQKVRTAIAKYKKEVATWSQERMGWLVLVRQMILEVQSLDESVEDCRCFPHTVNDRFYAGAGSSSLKANSEAAHCVDVLSIAEHSDCYSQLVLELIVDGVNTVVFNHHVTTYTKILGSTVPQFVQLCYLKYELEQSLVSRIANGIVDGFTATPHTPAAIAGLQRNQITLRSTVAWQWQNALCHFFYATLQDMCTELKPLLDIVGVIKPHISTNKPTMNSVSAMLKQYGTGSNVDRSVSSTPTTTSVNGNYDCAYAERNAQGAATYLFSYHLRSIDSITLQFCRAISFHIELNCSLSFRKTVFTGQAKVEDASETGGDWNCQIYEEVGSDHRLMAADKSAGTTTGAGKAATASGNHEDDTEFYNRMNKERTEKEKKKTKKLVTAELSFDDAKKMAQQCQLAALVGHFVLNKIVTDSMINKVQGVLQQCDCDYLCPPPNLDLHLERCHTYLGYSSHRLLVHYNSAAAHYIASMVQAHLAYSHNTIVSKALEEHAVLALEVEDIALREECFHRSEIAVSKSALAMVIALDMLAVYNCVIFQDTPPHLKSAPSIERALPRQKSMTPVATAHARQTKEASRRQSSMGLQLDIERMFSEKIVICNYATVMQQPSNANILAIVGKVVLKSFQEHIRGFHFYPDPKNTSGFSTDTNSSFIMLQLRVDLMFLKQICVYLLKETSETDRLVESCLSALANRCCVHTAAAVTSGEDDFTMVNLLESTTVDADIMRSINEAVLKLSKSCALIHK